MFMRIDCLYLGKNELQVEKQQLIDEGKDISVIEREFEELMNLDEDREKEDFQRRAVALLNKAKDLPTVADYKYREPSELGEIKVLRPEGPRKLKLNSLRSDDDFLYDRLYGAFLGRCCGCLLGKPVEGWPRDMIEGYLRDLNRYPLDDYFRMNVDERVVKKYNLQSWRAFVDCVDHMVEDDDINYTIIGLQIIKAHGYNFTPMDVALSWMTNLPILHTYTAERVAYRNFCQLIGPPESATYCNVYREWIGARIRADFYGYAAIGNPELAAELAFRDASISHIKNGIYGAMWTAAMLSVAPLTDNVREIIQIGLSEIPKTSRLYSDIQEVIDWYESGVSYEDAASRIHKKWNEKLPHHWCHNNSNAQIVAVGLLWGENDFGKSVCRAVQIGFDTDCNGATVGSIVGMMLGAKKLPQKWTSPLNDLLESCIPGYYRAKISGLARESVNLCKNLIK
jgi:hypothetical protein